jgi:protein-S-isoprenylcysteine O-methyltransferase Ste14
VSLWVSGYALFANYLTPYLVVVLSIPVMLLVVLLEERELRERFGEEYQAYCRRVPRFFRRRSPRKGTDGAGVPSKH